jgi:hypothetical protein
MPAFGGGAPESYLLRSGPPWPISCPAARPLSPRRIAMSDEIPEEPARPEMVRVTIEIPAGLLAGYDDDVERGIHPSREAALLHGLVESHRHHKGRYSTLRIDLREPNDRRPDTPRDEGSAADAIAAADALTDPETGQPEAGEDDDRRT